MFGAQSTGSSDAIADTWERTFASAPLRVMLDELPQADGGSKPYKEKVEEELRAFQERFGWLIEPLLVPVALEVVVKPSPPSRRRGLHDLDNVLRDYLIPKVTDVLKPISHFAWTRDDAATAPEKPLPGTESLYTRPPPSTLIGVIRYEAWRLPPAVEGGRGFVGVAVVADSTGLGGALSRIEDDIWRWKDAID